MKWLHCTLTQPRGLAGTGCHLIFYVPLQKLQFHVSNYSHICTWMSWCLLLLSRTRFLSFCLCVLVPGTWPQKPYQPVSNSCLDIKCWISFIESDLPILIPLTSCPALIIWTIMDLGLDTNSSLKYSHPAYLFFLGLFPDQFVFHIHLQSHSQTGPSTHLIILLDFPDLIRTKNKTSWT